ncbi:hypothetical protein NQ314_016604, partial [Rhamnusium bicolor]
RQNLEDLWASDRTGVDIFRATMALKRFQFLLTCLRFDDRASRRDSRSLDKLAPISVVFDRFVDHCLQSYAPSEYVTIDEKLEEFCGQVYVGEQPWGPFRLCSKPEDIVLRLVEPIRNSRRNVTVDDWFTSYPVVVKLFNEYELTSIGTIKKNKWEIPPQLLAVRNREVISSQFAFQEDVTMVSYSPKKNPDIITFYNRTKGGCGRYG